MPRHRPIALIVLPLALSAGAEPEDEVVPVIQPPPPAVQQSAEAGDPAAQFAMANYHLGDEHPAVMLRWLRTAAYQGYPLAQVSLGVLYETGDSAPQDPFAAYAWFTRATWQGDLEAAQFAASLYTAMEDDERVFVETLARDGWAVIQDCRNR